MKLEQVKINYILTDVEFKCPNCKLVQVSKPYAKNSDTLNLKCIKCDKDAKIIVNMLMKL